MRCSVVVRVQFESATSFQGATTGEGLTCKSASKSTQGTAYGFKPLFSTFFFTFHGTFKVGGRKLHIHDFFFSCSFLLLQSRASVACGHRSLFFYYLHSVGCFDKSTYINFDIHLHIRYVSKYIAKSIYISRFANLQFETEGVNVREKYICMSSHFQMMFQAEKLN